MARKKTSKSKLQPATRYLSYGLSTNSSAGTVSTHFIDLAKGLGLVNRRLYRQGRMYTVRRASLLTNFSADPSSAENVPSRVNISVVPPTWVAMNAWRRGFDIWMAHRKDVLKQTGTQNSEAAYADFKVYMNIQHRSAESSNTDLIPEDQSGNDADETLAEYIYSQVVSETNAGGAITNHELHMLGDHDTNDASVGLIKSYGETRATVREQMPGDTAFDNSDPLLRVAAFNQVEVQSVMTDVRNNNDTPPYALDRYPGDELNMPGALLVQQGRFQEGLCTLGGFQAMCGLIRLDVTHQHANLGYRLMFELAPGKYRGIDAEAI